MLTVVPEENGLDRHDPAGVGGSMLDELVRDGARQMLAAALQAEVAAYIEQHADQFDEDGRRLVVRNGYHAARQVATAAGAVPVQAPRVNDKRTDEATGERMRFASAILPAWCRKSPQVAEVGPLLYLHGLSSGDFGPALEQFLGSAAGLSAATITRFTTQWQDEAVTFGKRSLTDVDYVYVWVDGILLKVRLEQDKICLLVMIGVRVDGTKELIALADGFRESSQSWADLLRDCKRRGMKPPVLAAGDGALGFWKAVRDVFPDTREQRCWFHKIGNVLGSRLPSRWHRDGVQADRIRPSPMAHGQRTPPGSPRPRRHPLHQRQTGRTIRPIEHRTERRVTRLSTGLDNSSRSLWTVPGFMDTGLGLSLIHI